MRYAKKRRRHWVENAAQRGAADDTDTAPAPASDDTLRVEREDGVWEATAEELERVSSSTAAVLSDLVLLRKGYTKLMADIAAYQGDGKTLIQRYTTLATDLADAMAMIPVRQGNHRRAIGEFLDRMRDIARQAQDGLHTDWLQPFTAERNIVVLDEECASLLTSFTFMKPIIRSPEVQALQTQVESWRKIRPKLLSLHESILKKLQDADDLMKLVDSLRLAYVLNVWRYKRDLHTEFTSCKRALSLAFERLATGQDVPAATREIDETVDTLNRKLHAIQQFLQDYPKEVQRAMRESSAGVDELSRRVYLRTPHSKRRIEGEDRLIELDADQARLLRFSAPTTVVLGNLSVSDLRLLLRSDV